MIPPRVTAQLRRALGETTVHRVRIMQKLLTSAATDNIALLAAQDDPDIDLETDGTNVAQCPANARIAGMNLKWNLYFGDVNQRVEVLMFRDDDNENSGNFTPSNLFEADDSTVTKLVKRDTIWYDYFISGSNRDMWKRTITGFAGMKRVRKLVTGSRLELNFVNGTLNATTNISIVGTITTVK